MYLLVVLIPLFTSLFTLAFGRFIGRMGSSFLTVTGMLLSLFFAIFIYYEICLSNSVLNLYIYKFIDLAFLNIDISFFFDTITSIMILVVCFISLLVHIYSLEYMSHDPNFIRFMSYLSLFTFFMLFLVTADNFFQMFVGWEGVGLSSYLLIGFWNTRFLANKAAIKAMLVNRIGDLSLLIAFCIIFFFFGTLKYTVIFSLIPYFQFEIFNFLNFSFNLINIICFFLFIGAVGKSAQLGLHIWLPDAMEGPTPVSALIHAATMVTAGVFLIIRCSYIFEYSNDILIFISFIGGLTCLFSAMIGAFQFDIKKVVAYSTCSQLGYMFLSCGFSNYNVALFHLFNHAFFKALLFLSMGSIIHALSDEQDFRRMGGLVNLLPFTYVMVMVGSLSLLAIPFLTGYYSKDMILEFTFARFNINGFFLYLMGIIAAFFTAFYSTRLIYWIFLADVNFYRSNLNFIHEPNIFMTLPMFILFFFSVFIGYIFNESFIGIGSLFWGNSLFISFFNFFIFDAEFNLFFVKYIPLFVSIFGILSFLFSIKFFLNIYNYFFSNYLFIFIFKFFSKSMYFDLLFVDFFFFSLMKLSFFNIYKYLEKGFFELFLVFYINELYFFFNRFLKNFNSGLLFHYVFLILFFLILFFFVFEFVIKLNLFFLILIFFGFFFI